MTLPLWGLWDTYIPLATVIKQFPTMMHLNGKRFLPQHTYSTEKAHERYPKSPYYDLLHASDSLSSK